MRNNPGDQVHSATLVKKTSKRHYEVRVKYEDDAAISKAVRLAFMGRLDGHEPKQGESYACRIYLCNDDMFVIKLTKKNEQRPDQA